jgi:hypothetical protein
MASQPFPCGIKFSNNQQLLKKIICTNLVQLKFGFGDFMFDKFRTSLRNWKKYDFLA